MASSTIGSNVNKKVVLIDFDGVILRNCSAYNVVVHRCEQYVNRHISIRNPVKIKEINNQLYETYGHTAIGLRKMGFDVTVEEFNRFVYGYIDKSYFRDVRAENNAHIKDFANLRQHYIDQGVQMFVFSNAPDVWCKTALVEMDPQFSDIETLSSVMTSNLKPEEECYNVIEKAFSSDHDLWFIDDKLQNMVPVMNRPRWKKLLLTNATMDDPVKIKEDLYTIQSLKPLLKT